MEHNSVLAVRSDAVDVLNSLANTQRLEEGGACQGNGNRGERTAQA